MEREELINKYKKMYELLNIINYLFNNNGDMDLYVMNYWLSKIISFYKVYGIELNVNDFRVSNTKDNSFLNEYMNVYFDNINRLDDDSFSQLLFKMDELDVSCESDNPILSIVKEAVNSIKNKNIKILDNLFEIIDNELVDLGIGKVNLDNIDSVREKLETEIRNNDNLSEQEDIDQEKTELNDSYEKYLIQLLANSKENTNVDDIKNNLDSICLLIVRLKIFDIYKNDYMNYAKACGYKKILDVVKRKMLKYKKLMDKSEVVEFLYNSSSKQIILAKLYNKMNKLKSDCDLIITNYINGFYDYIEIDSIIDKYGEFGIDDDTKLFGLFDFERIPRVSNVKLENMGIESIDVNMDGFDEISELAFDYIKRNSKNIKYRKK